ncbi:YncE family protein [Zobellia galactanivorans]|uniref:Hypothetical periplasmic protein n=1 Tax=Zobellia galactanivorans (strain DSM 12802 / CCUG 47099 / CIP 106680 / NCIMB 13871 / Dsij) TaxID=63186 RepID=G0LA28_ZOBGA|nr:hypothetical protein [Zobellia galactanivorans]CAZ95001.1 Hypothetical periplasmic protein [Zobellia galactanivorans]
MKITKVYTAVLALTSLLFINCSKGDDDNGGNPPVQETPTIEGTWKVVTNNYFDDSKYFIINEDNTLHILYEDNLGFKGAQNANYTNNEEELQLTINFGYASLLANYTVSSDDLVLNFPDGSISLTKETTALDPDNWIKKLKIINEGDAPWTESIDIAWNGSQLVIGNGYEAEAIGLVNPETFALEGTIATTRSAFAVEIENYDDEEKYIFQSDNGNNKFHMYDLADNTHEDESLPLGSWIHGLASIDHQTIWASSNNEDSIYLYDYDSKTILQTIDLEEKSPNGLDYQAGYLYICASGQLYKCDVSDGFEVIESYTLPDYSITGIAYDGSYFWVYAEKNSEGKLVQLDLSI